jgi:glycosyltransferase involved in cell wall biosynthesis
MGGACLFIGSFRTTAEGRGGGQNRQCELLLRTRPAPGWRWLPMDVTDESTRKSSLASRMLRGLRRCREAVRAAREGQATVALVFTSCYPLSLVEKGLIGLALRRRGLRIVFSYRSQLQAPLPASLAWPLRLCRIAGDHHLVQGERARDALLDLGVDAGGISILPNLVDMEPPQATDGQARPLSGHVLSLLYVGWLEDIKGVDVLLQALAEATRQGMEWRLRACGMGTRGERLAQMAKDLGIADRIDWAGWLDRPGLARAYAEADLLVLPSRSEGLPNAILEAYSAALPVLATRVGGVPGIVEEGVTGMTCPPGDAAALAACLMSLAADRPRLRGMGLRAREFLRRRHGMDAVLPVLRQALVPGSRQLDNEESA